jgi:LysM repeat protein
MRKIFIALSICINLLSPVGTKADTLPDTKISPFPNPSQVIGAINTYRQQNGLNPLSTNSTLMALAQAQSDYQASMGTITHFGPGGTTPKDRAYAAGYGAGNIIILSEIIFGGYHATVDNAMNFWKNSPDHNPFILDSRYIEIGAGVATVGEWTYFTAEIAWVTDSPVPAPSGSDNNSEDNGEDQGDPPAIAVTIVKATPMPDGSIIHIVRSGQFLWTIAEIYGVDLQIIYILNDLNENSIIYPGDEIIIRPPSTPTPFSSSTPPALDKTFTTDKTQVRSATSILGTPVSLDAINTAAGQNVSNSYQEGTNGEIVDSADPAARYVVVLAFVCIFLVVVGSIFLQKRPERPADDDVVR